LAAATGLLWTGGIGLAWLMSLVGLLFVGRDFLAAPWIAVAILGRTFLQTGLFIVGHDAMHRSLLPMAPRLNDRIGALALRCYAVLPWERCCRNHRSHHLAPGTPADPDFHGRQAAHPLAWYGRFMRGYLGRGQMGWLIASWTVLALLFSRHSSTAWVDVLLFCTLPLLLSSLQLFLFGTYLPHRAGAGTANRHHASSLAMPVWLSFLACFHFGYHWEHHEHPEQPWFRLPAQRRLDPVG
jgi:beta-carotene ketolase (CrtW type)